MTVLTSIPADGETETLSENSEREQVDDLIRQLVRQIASKCSPVQQQGQGAHEEIIVDMNVDGMRYMLVRMPSPVPSLVPLSPREQEIVRMVAKGYPNKTIAGVLNISCWTVGTHLRRTFAKLGVASRAAMVARLLEEGRVWDQAQPAEKALARPTGSSTTTPLRAADVIVAKKPPPKDAVSVPATPRVASRQKTEF